MYEMKERSEKWIGRGWKITIHNSRPSTKMLTHGGGFVGKNKNERMAEDERMEFFNFFYLNIFVDHIQDRSPRKYSPNCHSSQPSTLKILSDD